MVCALAVGGFVMAANIYGDQDHIRPDDVQKIVTDYFDPAETAPLQTSRTSGFVMESECDCWCFHTEQGYIDWNWNIPDPLPLCIDNDTLLGWGLTVFVYGGYEPYGGYIELSQKGEYKGTIYMQWTWDQKGPCCAYDYWKATFYVYEDICLDSDQYPDEYADDGYIPGKKVWFNWCTDWTGCPEPDQRFTIIHSHSYWAFSKSFILTLQTKTLTPIKTSRSMPQLASNLNGIDVHQIQYHMPFYNLERSYDEATLK
jgi:hypothetical protein